MSSVAITVDPESHLAALTSLGELDFVDIVLPSVSESKQANQIWMNYVEGNSAIIEAFGNPKYAGLQIDGSQPLHLQIWFTKGQIQEIQKLVDLLENNASESD